jgi:hypothetical protein
VSSPDTCTCDHLCPGESCACIFVYDDDEGDAGVCDCDCRSTIVIHSPVLLSARVAINTDGVELARLAAFLDERCEADVVVPEERDGEKVSLRMRDSTLANVIEAAGLTIRDSEPPATTSAY